MDADRSTGSRVVRLPLIASTIVALVISASAASYGQSGSSFSGPSCTVSPTDALLLRNTVRLQIEE